MYLIVLGNQVCFYIRSELVWWMLVSCPVSPTLIGCTRDAGEGGKILPLGQPELTECVSVSEHNIGRA